MMMTRVDELSPVSPDGWIDAKVLWLGEAEGVVGWSWRGWLYGHWELVLGIIKWDPILTRGVGDQRRQQPNMLLGNFEGFPENN